MPVKKYDRYFGGNAAKAKGAMAKEHGSERGKAIFHALINKKREKAGETEKARG